MYYGTSLLQRSTLRISPSSCIPSYPGFETKVLSWKAFFKVCFIAVTRRNATVTTWRLYPKDTALIRGPGVLVSFKKLHPVVRQFMGIGEPKMGVRPL